MLVRQAQESFVPHSPPKAALTRRPAKLTTPAAKALWQELGGKCVYLPAGWWMYEVGWVVGWVGVQGGWAGVHCSEWVGGWSVSG